MRIRVAALLALASLAHPSPRAEPRPDVRLVLPREAADASPRVEVLLPEPLVAGPFRRAPERRLARRRATFTGIVHRRARGGLEVALHGVPEGEVAVLATWSRGREASVVWRAFAFEAGRTVDLGMLRPLGRSFELSHRFFREDGGRGPSPAAADVLARGVALEVHCVLEPRGGAPRAGDRFAALAPVLLASLEAGGRLTVRGAELGAIERAERVGPEHLAPGWLLGPSRARPEGAFEQAVAPAASCSFVLDGLPPGTASVRLWARRDTPEGRWLAAPGEATRAEGGAAGELRGALALAPGPWRILAQARDAAGRPSGATGELALDVVAGAAPIALALPRAATLDVHAPGGAPGAAVRARPAGWSVDLDAAPLDAAGCARLAGLVPARVHEVGVEGGMRRVRTSERAAPTRVELELPPR